MNPMKTFLLVSLFLSMHAIASEPRHIAIPNAEDLALVSSGRWVVASSLAGLTSGAQGRGGLFLINARNGEFHKAYPGTVGRATAVWPGCENEVAAAAFGPHGIALQSIDGVETLFVVNHGQRESVEVFAVEGDEVPSLRWLGCLTLPQGVLLNAVAATPDGRVFVTDMGKREKGKGEFAGMGSVMVWSRDSGWETVPGSNIFAPNGLLVTDDGSTLYVNSWAAGEVIKVALEGETPTRQVLKLPFLPDNLRWGEEGDILAAGLRASAEAVVACVTSPGSCTESIPTGIARIDPESFAVECLLGLDYQMGTSALEVGDDLWVGTSKGDTLWVQPGGKQGWGDCSSLGR